MGLIDEVSKIADPYQRQARLYPATLAACPMVIAALIAFADQLSALTNLSAAIVACGLLYWMAGLARQRGKQLEGRLFRAWGGKPSVQLLRHRNRELDPITKARVHAYLAAALGISFPTSDDEAQDPKQADKVYESATRWLLEQTRHKDRHQLLMTENTAYAFRRNMLGMRGIGIAVATVAIGWLTVNAGLFPFSSLSAFARHAASMPPAHGLAVAACIGLGCMWLFGTSEQRARAAAFAYAERLIASCDALRDASEKPQPGGQP